MGRMKRTLRNDICASRRRQINARMGAPSDSYDELAEMNNIMRAIDEIIEMHVNDPKRSKQK